MQIRVKVTTDGHDLVPSVVLLTNDTENKIVDALFKIIKSWGVRSALSGKLHQSNADTILRHELKDHGVTPIVYAEIYENEVAELQIIRQSDPENSNFYDVHYKVMVET